MRALILLAVTIAGCGAAPPITGRSTIVEPREEPTPVDVTVEPGDGPIELTPGFGAMRLSGTTEGMAGIQGCRFVVGHTPHHVFEARAPFANLAFRTSGIGANEIAVRMSDGTCWFTNDHDSERRRVSGPVPAGSIQVFVGNSGHSLPYELIVSE